MELIRVVFNNVSYYVSFLGTIHLLFQSRKGPCPGYRFYQVLDIQALAIVFPGLGYQDLAFNV